MEARVAARSGKTANISIGMWYDEDAGDIHLRIGRHGISTVNGNPASERGNPHLFRILAKVLRDEGKPQPGIVEE